MKFMMLLGLKINLKCLIIFLIIMLSVVRMFCNKLDDLMSMLNLVVEFFICMLFWIFIIILIVSWLVRIVLVFKGFFLL